MARLGDCYKQLNSSVGGFGTDTLIASTRGLESPSPNDKTYTNTEQTLRFLDSLRDNVAGSIKGALEAAAFDDQPVGRANVLTTACNNLLHQAAKLAK